MLRVGKLVVRVIRPGESWGNCNEQVATQAMIEFYDPRITGRDKRGQIVARFYAALIYHEGADNGLELDERVPAWSLTGAQINDVRNYVKAMGA